MPAGTNCPSRPRDGLNGDAECLTGFGQPLASIAEVAECRTFEATLGERAQDRHDPFRVMPVRRRDVDRQRDAVFVDRNMDLDAADLLAAVDAALKAAWRRTTGSTVDHHSARLRSILTGEAPGAAQSVEQAAPEAKPGPASEQSVSVPKGMSHSCPIARHCIPQ